VTREPLAVLRFDAMAMRNRVSDLERLGATADARLDVTFRERPCIALFDRRRRQLSLVDAETGRSLASLQRMPHMQPLQLVGNDIIWDQRHLRVSDDVDHLAEAAQFVYFVNTHSGTAASIHTVLAPPSATQPAEDDRGTYTGPFWQFAIINIGMFRAIDRFEKALGVAASQGWELVGVYDKASNWLSGMEKGFILLKRQVPPGVQLREDEWCISLNLAGT
jgi:hypothetical protein